MNHTRERFQRGSLTIESRKSGPDVWVYRWRERSAAGSVKRKKIIGTKKQLPTMAAAAKAVDGLRLDVNGAKRQGFTVAEAAAHYRQSELTTASGKSHRTCEVYAHHLDKVILPKWASLRLSDVKPIAIERWLTSLPLAPGSRAKTRCVFSVVFQHAMRHEWAASNPVRLARQGSMPVAEPVVLEPVEISALLAELQDPFRAILYCAAVTGLRRGELFGLKWQDVDFVNGQITVVRSLVDQVEGPPKTLASRRPIPMAAELSQKLRAWQQQTSFPRPSDWVFASPHSLGRKPYWPDAVLKRHVLPAAERAGVVKKIGWHSFRRTLATLLLHSGASVKTAQELLRHASPQMTLSVYAKAVTADKRNAQETVAALFGSVASREPEVSVNSAPRGG